MPIVLQDEWVFKISEANCRIENGFGSDMIQVCLSFPIRRDATQSLPQFMESVETDSPLEQKRIQLNATPLPSPPRGRSLLLLKQNIFLETQRPHQPEKDSTPCPLPWERGKSTWPIVTIIWVRSNRRADQSSRPSWSPISPEPVFTMHHPWCIVYRLRCIIFIILCQRINYSINIIQAVVSNCSNTFSQYRPLAVFFV